MANIPTRGIKMSESLIIRATEEDKSSLKLKANQQGVSMSQLVRELLIRQGYIPPSSTKAFDIEV